MAPQEPIIPRPDESFDEDIEDLIQKINAFKTDTTPPPTPLGIPLRKAKEPTYMTSHEQFLKVHSDDLKKALQTSDLLSSFSEIIAQQAKIIPDRNSITLAQNLFNKSQQYKEEGREIEEGMKKAQEVVRYYDKTIPLPALPKDDSTQVMIRDIISLTGYFDPEKDPPEFKHIWTKLYDYGTTYKFSEHNYKQALSAIMKGEAYETFMELKERKTSLTEILDHFVTIYGSKRSIVTDKINYDNFFRKKNESIKSCVERCKLVVDRLRHLYSDSLWPEMRVLLLKQSIMQLLLPDTKNYVITKENNILQTTGFHLPIDKLIYIIESYENLNSKVPKYEVHPFSKISQTKSIEPENLITQVAHLKQEQKKAQQIAQENDMLKTIISSNYTRPYKNSDRSDRSRERRKEEFEKHRAESRSSSVERNRQNTSDSQKTMATPITPMAFKDYQNAYDKARSSSPFVRSTSQDRFRTENPKTSNHNSRTEKMETDAKSSSYHYRPQSRSRDYSRERGRSPYRTPYPTRDTSSHRSSTPHPGYTYNSRNRSSSRDRSSPSRFRDNYRRFNDYTHRDSSLSRYNNYQRNYDYYPNRRNYYNQRSKSYDRPYYQRSYSKDRQQNYKSNPDKDPNTERLTFSNEAKSIILTMVEKPHLN